MTEWIYDPRAGRCRKTDGGQAVSDKIEEIRARHTSDTWRRYEIKAQIHDDRAFLLAEDERLRAENERLRAENERLKQEPELLRAELISLSNAARNALADAYDRARDARWKASHERARNALEGEP